MGSVLEVCGKWLESVSGACGKCGEVDRECVASVSQVPWKCMWKVVGNGAGSVGGSCLCKCGIVKNCAWGCGIVRKHL